MPRVMSCSLTTDAVRNRTKTVTRRHRDTWRTLTKGDRLILVEKAMGLPKGSRQVKLAEVEVVDVRLERLCDISADDLIAEGFPHLDRWAFVDMFTASHRDVHQSDLVRRVEWRYLKDDTP